MVQLSIPLVGLFFPRFTIGILANFHLRNGAELFRLNWNGDSSYRGVDNSLGIMVNYRYVFSVLGMPFCRYYMDRVSQHSTAYTHEKTIAADPQFTTLL